MLDEFDKEPNVGAAAEPAAENAEVVTDVEETVEDAVVVVLELTTEAVEFEPKVKVDVVVFVSFAEVLDTVEFPPKLKPPKAGAAGVLFETPKIGFEGSI